MKMVASHTAPWPSATRETIFELFGSEVDHCAMAVSELI